MAVTKHSIIYLLLMATRASIAEQTSIPCTRYWPSQQPPTVLVDPRGIQATDNNLMHMELMTQLCFGQCNIHRATVSQGFGHSSSSFVNSSSQNQHSPLDPMVQPASFTMATNEGPHPECGLKVHGGPLQSSMFHIKVANQQPPWTAQCHPPLINLPIPNFSPMEWTLANMQSASSLLLWTMLFPFVEDYWQLTYVWQGKIEDFLPGADCQLCSSTWPALVLHECGISRDAPIWPCLLALWLPSIMQSGNTKYQQPT